MRISPPCWALYCTNGLLSSTMIISSSWLSSVPFTNGLYSKNTKNILIFFTFAFYLREKEKGKGKGEEKGKEKEKGKGKGERERGQRERERRKKGGGERDTYARRMKMAFLPQSSRGLPFSASLRWIFPLTSLRESVRETVTFFNRISLSRSLTDNTTGKNCLVGANPSMYLFLSFSPPC